MSILKFLYERKKRQFDLFKALKSSNIYSKMIDLQLTTKIHGHAEYMDL